MEFDQSKHLAEATVKQRKQERERIAGEERQKVGLYLICLMDLVYFGSLLLWSFFINIVTKEFEEKRKVELDEMKKNEQMWVYFLCLFFLNLDQESDAGGGKRKGGEKRSQRPCQESEEDGEVRDLFG